MIPYDDLVAALAAWRSRQGLPTGMPAGAGSGPVAARPAPQTARPAAAAPAPAPAPRAVTDDSFDVEESALLEEASFDSELAGAFGALEEPEATAIGGPPEPPPRRGGR